MHNTYDKCCNDTLHNDASCTFFKEEESCTDFSKFQIYCNNQLTVYLLLSIAGYSLYLISFTYLAMTTFSNIMKHLEKNEDFQYRVFKNCNIVSTIFSTIYLSTVIYTFIIKGNFGFNIINDNLAYMSLANIIIQFLSEFLNIILIGQTHLCSSRVSIALIILEIVLPVILELCYLNLGLSKSGLTNTYYKCCIDKLNDKRCRFINPTYCTYEDDFYSISHRNYYYIHFIQVFSIILYSYYMVYFNYLIRG